MYENWCLQKFPHNSTSVVYASHQ